MTQLQINTARLGIITVISHSCSHILTLVIRVSYGTSKKEAKAKKQ